MELINKIMQKVFGDTGVCVDNTQGKSESINSIFESLCSGDFLAESKVDTLDSQNYAIEDEIIYESQEDAAIAELPEDGNFFANTTSNNTKAKIKPQKRMEELYEIFINQPNAYDTNAFGKRSIPNRSQIDLIVNELSDTEYTKFMELYKAECVPTIAINVAQLNEDQYSKWLTLVDSDMSDLDALNLARLDEEQFERYFELIDNGANSNNALSKARLNEDQYSKYLELVDTGMRDNYALDVAPLADNQRSRYFELVDSGAKHLEALNLAQLNDNQYSIYNELVDNGMKDGDAMTVARLDDKLYSRYIELTANNISHGDSLRLARLEDNQYSSCLELLEKGVHFDTVSTSKLNNNAGTEIVITDSQKNGEVTTSTVYTIRNDNTITEEWQEKHSDGTIKSGYNNSGRYYEHGTENFYQIEIITDEATGKSQANYTKPSELLPGAYDIMFYDLGIWNGDSNIIQSIKDGSLEGGIPIAETVQNPDGSITFKENFEINNSEVQRTYTQLKDDSGKLIRSEYSYAIIDEKGNKTLNLDRTLTQNPDGTATTIINGKEYTASFDDKKRTIQIDNGTEITTVEIQPLIDCNSNKNEQQLLWECSKTLPADLIYDMGKYVVSWQYCDIFEASIDPTGRLMAEDSLQTIAHELGHISDYHVMEDSNIEINIELLKKYSDYSHPGLLTSYEEEMYNFKNVMTSTGQDYISYFSQKSVGLAEFIAETRMLLTTYGNDLDIIQERAHVLAHYFPKTISYIAEMLDLNDLNVVE